jgi:16S rRNA C967 or C1407 C5-methylase (RsmB/RsmF family)
MACDGCGPAPGGKSCYIGQLMWGTGRVTAMDLHPHRVELISAYAKRMRLDNVRPRVADASQMDESLYERMDAVLVDAPCSGLGVLHHKPDIKYTVSSEQLTQLPQTQRAILESAAQAVRPGACSGLFDLYDLGGKRRGVRGFLKDHRSLRWNGGEHLTELMPAACASAWCS